MKRLIAAGLAAALTSGAARAGAVDFDATPTNALPRGWVAGVTGGGAPDWQVVTDDSLPGKSRALKQSSEFAGHIFPWCVDRDVALKDGFVQVKFKTVSGK